MLIDTTKINIKTFSTYYIDKLNKTGRKSEALDFLRGIKSLVISTPLFSIDNNKIILLFIYGNHGGTIFGTMVFEKKGNNWNTIYNNTKIHG